MGKKKRAWGPSNPLYRYIHGGKPSGAPRKAAKRDSMGKRKGSSSRGSRGFLGGGLISSLIAGVVGGYGARHLNVNLVNGDMGPAQGAAIGFGASKVMGKNAMGGVIGGVLGDMLATGKIGGMGASSSSSTGIPAGIPIYGQ